MQISTLSKSLVGVLCLCLLWFPLILGSERSIPSSSDYSFLQNSLINAQTITSLHNLPVSHPNEPLAIQNTKNPAVHLISLLPWERANAVAFSPNGNYLAVATPRGIHIYEMQTYSEVQWIAVESWVRDIDFSPDGEVLAGGIFDNSVQLWRVSDGAPISTLRGHTNWIRSVDFSPDGTMLASASDDNTVRVWDVSNHKLLYALQTGTLGVRCLAFSPDSQIFATGSEDGTIHLWNAKEGTLINNLKGHTGWIRTLAFSHDGSILASGSFDATARLWRVSDGTLLHTLKGHTASVLSVAFSPDDEILATGSVDTTIGLWRPGDGKLITILKGHSDFIYDIAISPNGDLLASGSEDSTVRLWDFTEAAKTADLVFNKTSPVCQTCHHPRAGNDAAPVVEVRCNACHPAGASLNWCPAFPQSKEAIPVIEQYTLSHEGIAGVPVGGETIGLTIISPGNGETIYTHYENIAPLFVRGKVVSDKLSVEKVRIQLEVWSGSEIIANLKAQPNLKGNFEFRLGVNPSGYMQFITDAVAHMDLDCAGCHNDFDIEAFLPLGDVRLVIIATTPNGTEARDERWINVDVSRSSTIEVLVIDEASDKPLPGIAVQASTRLYEWRGRTFNAVTNEAGIAKINLELLSQAPTGYWFHIPKQIVGGIYYSGTQDEMVIFPVAGTSVPSITLKAQVQIGKITGHLELPQGAGIDSIPVLAVQLPAGPIYRTETIDGNFLFTHIPIARYTVFPDSEALTSLGFTGESEKIDLTLSPEIELPLRVEPMPQEILQGRVSDHTHQWLPFAWLASPEGKIYEVDKDSGKWAIVKETPRQHTIIVSAPGYFSQSFDLNGSGKPNEEMIIELQRRPEMRSLVWGTGEILIPPETKAEATGNRIALETGWIWGTGSGDPLVIHTPEVEITLSKGRFALERLPQRTAWFYLFDGEAEVTSKKTGGSLNVQPMTMVAIDSEQLAHLPYDAFIASTLNPTYASPIPPVWQPSLLQKISTLLVKLGINTAMLITIVTYLVAILSLAIPPVVTLKWLARRKKVNRRASNERSK